MNQPKYKIGQEVKYALHPGDMYSKNDGDEHYISAPKLAHLYGVKLEECIVIESKRPESYRGRNMSQYIHLYPSYSGNYQLPKKN